MMRFRNVLVAGLVVAAVAMGSPRAASAQAGKELCLGCHGQQGLTTVFQDKEIDLYVDPAKYAASPHGQQDCVSCHPQFQGFDHGRVALGEELRAITLRTCLSCHQGYDFAQGKVSCHPDPLTCEKCHGPSHAIVPRSDPASPLHGGRAVEFCASCHRPEEASYYYSFHGSAYRLGSRQAPLCIDCHGHLSPVNGEVEEASLMCGNCHSGSAAALANLLRGQEHVTPQDREKGFPLWVVWKFFLVVILVNTAKDGSLVLLDLTHRWRRRGRRGGEGGGARA